MARTDRYGLPISTSSDVAAAAYRDGIDLTLSAWTGADAAFDSAIAADPDFALAHVARARLHFTYAEPAAMKARLADARTAVARNGDEREKSHVQILGLAMEGQSPKALSAALAHLDLWPRDALILSQPLGAFGLFAFSGMRDHDQARVDLCERHASHYGDDWWFETYLGWSLTENHAVPRGRELTQRALDKRRENANAAHALAHAMFEDGSTAAADALIDDWLPCYDRGGILYGHIFWHQALAALENGDTARALAIYRTQLGPAVTQAVPLNAITDCAALLWRIDLDGRQVPQAMWSELATYGDKYFPSAGITFADVHVAFIAAANGNTDALDARIAAIEKRLADGKLAAGAVVPAVCRASRAFAQGDYSAAVRHLDPVACEVARIGGSHAQREIFEDMLIVALIKSGEPVKAHALLDRRLHHRASVRDRRWREAAYAMKH